MRIARAIIFAILCIAIGYGIGRFGPQRSEEIEDLAISNLLEQLGYAHYLTSSDTKNIKELVDTNIHANLNLLRMHHGAVSDPTFIEAEIQNTSSNFYLLAENPPFTSLDYKPNTSNAVWINEWNENQKKNLQILAWAQKECETRPHIKCKQP